MNRLHLGVRATAAEPAATWVFRPGRERLRRAAGSHKLCGVSLPLPEQIDVWARPGEAPRIKGSGANVAPTAQSDGPPVA
jgi:hypothetical protein